MLLHSMPVLKSELTFMSSVILPSASKLQHWLYRSFCTVVKLSLSRQGKNLRWGWREECAEIIWT